MSAEHTTLWVSKSTASRLRELKQFPSVSFDDLLQDMADNYEEEISE